MTGSLGRLLGDGRTAEVFDFGPGRVIKLLRPGFSETALRVEAVKTASAEAAGAAAPSVHGLEQVEGRLGLILDRAEGDLLVDRILAAPHRIRHWGRVLAETHSAILERSSDSLPDIREFLAEKIERAEPLDRRERAAAKDTLGDLPDGTTVLHGDFHPLNVFISGSQTTVIDWLDATRGPIEPDIVRSLWLTSTHVIPPDFPKRWAVAPIAGLLGRSYRSAILDKMDLTPVDLDRWSLPVLAGRLSEGISHEEAALTARVRKLIIGG